MNRKAVIRKPRIFRSNEHRQMFSGEPMWCIDWRAQYDNGEPVISIGITFEYCQLIVKWVYEWMEKHPNEP